MKLIRNLYFGPNFYRITGLLIGLWIVAYPLPFLLFPVQIISLLYSVVLLWEIVYLFRRQANIEAQREVSDRLSNGDANPVQIKLLSLYNSPVKIEVLDEIPAQFQLRNHSFKATIQPLEELTWDYHLRPVKRGPYEFGKLRIYVSFLSHSIQRALVHDLSRTVKTYPSYLDLRRYELMAFSDQLRLQGQKRVRQIAVSKEFEKIDKYVEGDDYRRINWKATARTGELMVNHYRDERSQNILMAIDKGRAMKMPFGGMSLLDYAINASLMISNVALKKGDRAGMVSVQDKVQGQVLPESRASQMMRIMEALYAEKTAYKETDIRALYRWCSYSLKERSLIMLYSNFESLHALKRQLPYLKLINRSHRLLLIFFLNEEVEDISMGEANSLQEVYRKALAEDFVLEKRRIAHALQREGIQTLLTRPEDLNIKALNKYLEIKQRGLI
ncbi:DUF58 domain-containing protein [Croceimicrobium sp.]|uniref:DUF58 domain-containing protein n=1 Tax=Croceimicrobium sp. TaxID=2828340 RepID=UPI003BAD24EC